MIRAFILSFLLLSIQQPPPARIYAVLRDVPEDAYALVWSPDGHWLATWDESAVWLYDATDFTAPPRIVPYEGRLNTLAFHPNGSWWVTAANGYRIRSLNGGMEPITIAESARSTSAAFSVDGTWLYWLHDEGGVARQRAASFFNGGEESPVSVPAISEDLPVLLRLMPVSSQPETVMALVSSDPTDRAALTCVVELVYVPQNTPPTRRLCVVPEVEGILLNPLVSSPDTLMFAASGEARHVMIFAETRITIETNNWVSALAFSPDGEWLAFGENPGLLGFWNTQDRTRLFKQDIFRGGIRAIAFNPADGAQIATLHNGVIQVWTLDFTDS